MADEEETREVLFPDWEGPDNTGLTLEQTTEGDIFVKEVKDESPAARSGKVYEGDQIVGATIYFDNMSSEETSDLLKTLNRHKVGLKLQNKGDKSPCCSPLSTPCRSPMGTLTWEGKTRFGGSSPDIILSGDDEDYKRIYTKKIKPRLKSEDLAEGVDVRTERHSSTSSDGSTITTITRRITTYTVDMPGGISEELSSPEFKGLRHESGDGSPRFRISHGSPSGKEGTEEGVFASSDVSYSGPHVSSTETHWGSRGVKTTTITGEKEKERNTGLGFKGSNFGKSGGSQGDFEILRGSGERGGGSFQVSGTSMTIRDSSNTASGHVTKGEMGGAEGITSDGGSISMSLPEKRVSEVTISHPQAKGSGSIDIPKVRQGEDSIDIDTELRGGMIGSAITLGSVSSGYSTGQGTISIAGVDVTVPTTGGEFKAPKVDFKGANVNIERKEVDLPQEKIASFGTPGVAVKVPHAVVESSGVKIKGTKHDIDTKVSDVDIKVPGIDVKSSVIDMKGNKIDVESSGVNVKVPTLKIDIGGLEGGSIGLKDASVTKMKGGKTNVKTHGIDVKAPVIDAELKGQNIKIPSNKGPKMPLEGQVEGDVNITIPKMEKVGAPKAGITIKAPEVEYSSGNIKGSKFIVSPFSGPKVSTPNTDLSSTGRTFKSDVDVSSPAKLDIKGPELDTAGPEIKMPEVKGPKFNLPTMSTPKVSMPDLDWKLKCPKLKSGVEVSTLEIGGDIERPEVDTKGPDVDIEGSSGGDIRTPDIDLSGAEIDIEGSKGGFKMPKIKMPSFNLKGAKGEDLDVDVEVTEANINVKGPNVDIKAPAIDIEGPDAKVKGPKFDLPTISVPKVSMPDLDWKLKGPKLKPDVEVSTPERGDIKAPKVDIKGPGVDIEGSSGGFNMPKFKLPSFGVMGPKVNADVSTVEGDIKASKVDIDGPEFDMKSPSGKITGPKFNLPSISGTKIPIPDVDFDLKGANVKGDVDVSIPKIEGDIRTPDIDLSGAEIDIEGSKGGFKMPKIKMPSFNLKGAKGEDLDVDVEVTEANINVKGPNVDIKAPAIDIEGPDAKVKGPKFDLPTISVPKVSMPDLDWKLKGPKLKPDVEVSAPERGDIKAPKVDIKGPGVDIEGSSGGFNMPKFKLPSFGVMGPKVNADVSTVEGDIKASKVDIDGPEFDMKSPSGKITGPKFNLPSISGTKIPIPDVDFNLKGANVKGDVDVSIPKIEGDIRTPDIDLSGAEIDIEGSKGGFKMPKIKMPSFNLKGAKGEDLDVDVEVTEANINVKGPKVDIKAPAIDIEGPDAKVKGPKFDLPTISVPKVSKPDLDWKLKGPKLKPDVEVSTPERGDIKAPKVDIKGPGVDIEGSSGGFNMPKFKLPSFGVMGPKVNADVSTVEGDIKASKVNIDGPEFDMKSPSGKITGPKFNLPSISGTKIPIPDVDFDLKGANVKGDVDVSIPKIEGDIRTLDIEGSKGGFKMPKIKMPSFNLKGAKGEDLDVDVEVTEANINVKGPKVDIKAPAIDIEGPDAKVKGPKFDLPTISVPKVSMPDLDWKLKGPKLKPDVEVSTPERGDIKAPKVDIKGPGVDIEGSSGGFNMPKFKLPSFGVMGPKVNADVSTVEGDIKASKVDIDGPEYDMKSPSGKITGPKFNLPSISGTKIPIPDVDFDLKGANVKGDVDVSIPKIEGDIRTPDIDLSGAEIDIEGSKGGFKMPKIKMPSFNLKGAKGEDLDVDVEVTEANINVKGPKVDIKAPAIDIEGPDAKVKGPKFDLPTISVPKVSMPDLDWKLKGPKLKPDVEVSTPERGDIKAPKVDIKGPGVDIEGSSGGFNMPKFKLPSFGVMGPKVNADVSTVEGDIKASKVDIDGPEFDMKSPSGKITGPKFNLPSISGTKIPIPDVDFNLKRPNVKGDVDVSIPKIEGDIRTPDIDLSGAEIDIEGSKGGFKMPKIKMPSFNLKGAKGEDLDVDVEVTEANINVKGPKVDIKAPAIDIEGPDAKVKGPKFDLPTISVPKVSMPDLDWKLKGPKLKPDVEVSAPERGDIKAPKVDIKGPGVDIEGSSGGFNMPKFKLPSFGVMGPKVNADVSTVEGDIKASKVDIDGPEFDMKSPSGKITGPKFNLPSISGTKIPIPDVDFNLKGPNLKGDVDVSIPKIEGDIRTLDIEGSKGGFKMPKIKMPSFNLKGAKGEDLDVDVEVTEANINVKGPKVDIKAPAIDIEGPDAKVKGPKFDLPTISVPKVSMPDLDWKLKGPKLKPDVEVSTPERGDIKAPKVDIKGPGVDIEGSSGGFNMPKFKLPSFGVMGPKVNADVSTVEGDIKASKVDIDGPEFDMKSPSGKITGPKFNLPSISGTKIPIPDVDFNLKGANVQGDVDVSIPKIEGDIRTPDIDLSGAEIDIEGSKGGFKMPKIKMPSFNLKGAKGEDLDVDVEVTEANINVKGPKVDIKAPAIDIEGPDAKVKGPKFDLPTISVPKVSMPDLDWKLKGPKLKPDVEVSTPERGDIKAPKVDIKGPGVDIEGSSGGFNMPKFKLPSFGVMGPKVNADVSTVKGDIKASKVDIDGPEFDMKSPSGKITGPKFNLPSISGTKIPIPDVDFNLKGANVKGDVDVSIPKIEGDIRTLDIEGSKGGFKMPKIKMPSFNLKGAKGEDLDVDVEVTEANINVKGPKVDIKAPAIDIEGPDAKVKGPKFDLPTISVPKVSMPDLDWKLKGPKLKPDVEVSTPERGDIKAPKVEIKGPGVDIEGSSGGFNMPKFKLPSFGVMGPKVNADVSTVEGDIKASKVDIDGPEFDMKSPSGKITGPKFNLPSISGTKIPIPDVDFNLKGANVQGDVDVSIPKIEGDIRTPDIDLSGAEIDIEGSKGGFKMPKIKMPSFNLKGAKGEDLDVDVEVTEANINVKGPKVDIKAPAIDIEGPDAKVKGPKFDLPTISVPKVSMPDLDWKLKGPKLKPDVEVSAPERGDIKAPKVDIKGPGVDIEGSSGGFKVPKIKVPSFSIKVPEFDIKGADIDIESPSGKIKGPKLNMPAFSGPKIPMPVVDLNLKSPKIKGDLTVPETEGDFKTTEVKIKGPNIDIPTLSGPKMPLPHVDIHLKGPKFKGDLKGDVQVPKAEIEAPDFAVDVPQIETKKTKFEMPKFGFKGSKIKIPKTDVKLAKGDIRIKGKTISSGEIDVDMGLTRPKTNGSKFKMPKFGFKSPKSEMPEVDLNLSNAGTDIKTPDVDVEGPDVKIETTGPKFKLPTISKSTINMPSLDFNLKGPNLKGDVDVSIPKIEGDIRTLDIEGSKGGFKMPKIKMPSFNLKGAKGEDLDVDVEVTEANINVKGPKVDIKAPAIDIEGPDAKVKGPKFDLPTISVPKVSMPDLDWKLKGPKLKPDVEVSTPERGDIKAPKVDIKGPGVDIEGSSGGFNMPKFKLPSFGVMGPKVNADVSTVEGDIKASKVDIDGPEFDMKSPSGKITGPKFNLPSISGTKIPIPDVDFDLKGANVKGDVDVSIAKIEGDIRTPDIDLSGAEIDIEGSKGGFKMPKIKMPSFNLKGAKGEDLDVDVEVTKANINVKGPKVDIKAPAIDIEGPDAKVKGPKFDLPTISVPKVSMPDLDWKLKGPKLKPDVEVSTPDRGDIKAPKVDIKGPGVDIEGSSGGFNMPKFKLPSFGVMGPKVNADVSTVEGDIKASKVDIDGPEFDMKSPSGKITGPKFNLPSISGTKIPIPDVDFNLKGANVKGDVDVSIPKIEGDIRTPDIDLSGAEIDIEGSKGGFKMPKIKMPSFNLKGAKGEDLDVDVEVTDANINVKGPKVDIKAPAIDIEGPDAKVKGPKFDLPTISVPKVSMPDLDWKLKGPKLKPDVEVSTPERGDIKAPKVDIKGPGVDIEGSSGGFNMPKFKLPSFGVMGPKVNADVSTVEGDIKASKVNIDGPEFDMKSPSGKITGPKFNLPSISGTKIPIPDVDFNLKGANVKGDVDVSIPKIEGDIRTPDIDLSGAEIDIEGSKGGFKMPKIKMPSFNLKGAKGEDLDVDVEVTEANINVKGPKVDIKAPAIDIEGPDAKVKGPKFDLPTISVPKVSMPDLDWKLKGPKLKPDVEVSTPERGDIKAPKVDIKGPGVDIEGSSGGFNMPKFKLPSFGVMGPKVNADVSTVEGDIKASKVDIDGPEFDMKSPSGKITGPKFNLPSISGTKIPIPDVDFNLKGPNLKGDVDVSIPKIEGDIRTLDIEGSKGGFKMPKIKMPSFNLKGAKGEDLDVDVEVTEANINVKGPKVDIKAPAIDIEGPDAKVKGPKFDLPTISVPKVSMPDLDWKLKGPKLKPDVEVSTPERGDIKAPKVDIKGPGVDIEGSSGGFNMPKFKLPSFGLMGPKVNADVSTVEGDIKASKVDIDGPEFDMKSPSGKITGPKFNLPSISGTKIPIPDVDFNLKGANVKGDVDVSIPKIEGDIRTLDIEGSKGGFKMPKIKMPSFNLKGAKGEDLDVDVEVTEANINVKGPKVDIKAPAIDIEGPDAKVKGPKFDLPTISVPKVSMPDLDWKLKGPKLKPDVEVSTPERGDIKAPKVDIKGPGVDIEGSSGGFNMPKFKLPSFGVMGPKVNADVSTVEGDIKASKVDIDGPEFDMKSPSGKITGPKFNLPSISGTKIPIPDVDFNLKGPNLKGDVDVSIPKIEGDIRTLDIEGSKGGFKMPKIKMPSFNLKGAKGEDLDVDVEVTEANINVKGPKVDIKAPAIDIEGPDAKVKGPKFDLPTISVPKVSMPDLDWKLKGPKLKPDVEVSAPERGDIKAPKVDIKGPGVDIEGSSGGFNMPKFKLPSFGVMGPKVNADVSTVEGDIKASKVDIDGPEFDMKSPSGKITGPKFNLPSISGTKIPIPDVDFNLKGPNVKGDVDVSIPKIEGEIRTLDIEGSKGGFKMPKIKMPSFNLKGAKGEDLDVDVEVTEANINVKGPKVDIKAPAIDIEGPDAKVKGPKFDLPTISVPKVSMPDLDWKLKGPKLKPDVEVSAPERGDIKAPKVDIKGPGVDIEGSSGGFNMPKFKLPSFGVMGPKVNADVSTVEGDIKASKVDIDGPEFDMKSPSGKITGPKFNLPSISGTKIPIPDVDFNLKGANVKGDVDVSIPKIEGDIRTPDIDLSGAEIDIEGSKGGFKMPKIKMPSFNLKGAKGEDLDVDVEVTEANINVKGPKVDIKAPAIDIEGPDAKVKGPKFDLPTISVPKVSMPDLDWKLKGPKLKPDVEVSAPERGDIKAPKVDIKGPGVDIEGSSGGFNMPKFKLPSFGVMGPKVNADVSTVEGNIKASKVDIDGPEFDMKSPSGKITGPKFNLPSISGTKIPIPDVDFNLKGANVKRDVDVSIPKIEGDIRTPDIDLSGAEIDIEGSKGGFKMPKIKMPSFNLKGAKGEDLDVDVEVTEANINVKGPKVDIKAPAIDIEGPDAKVKGPKFDLPTISVPKVSMPDLDWKLKGPKLKPDVEVSTPERGDIKAPKVDIKGPGVDIEGSSGGFNMPKFKLPSFGVMGPKVNADVSTVEGDIKASKVDIDGPEFDMKSPSGKITGPKFNLPSISGTKIPIPDVDFNLKGPNLKGDVDVSIPKIEGDIRTPDSKGADIDIVSKGGFNMPKFKMPSFGMMDQRLECPDVNVNLPKANIDVDIPKINIEGPDAKLKGPKINLPSVSVPKMPGWDISLKGPKVKGDVDVSVPKIEGDITTPKVDIQGPDVANTKGPKFEGPAIDLNLSRSNIGFKAADVNLKGSKIKCDMDASMPKVEGDTKDPNANIKAPTITIEGGKTGVSFPKFKGPKFGIKSLNQKPMISVGSKGSGTEVNLPDYEAPDIDINVKGKKGKFKLPKAKEKAKKHDLDIETPAVSLDVDTPNIYPKGTKVKKPLFGKLHFPDVELDIKSPKLKGDGSSEGLKSPDIELPSASLNTNIDGSGINRPNVSLAESDVKLKTPNIKTNKKGSAEIDANISGGSSHSSLQYPEGTVTFPKIKVPKFGIALPELQGQEQGRNVESELLASGGIHLQSPSVSCQATSQDIEVSSPELQYREGKVKGKMPKLFGKSKAKGGSVGDIRGPEVALSTSGKGSEDLNVHTGEVMVGKLDLGDAGLGVSTKGKSASLDLFKKSRHRSSLSDEGGLAVSSPSVHLETEGGDIPLDLGATKAKGKKSKLKFGTFGGFGSKSKGSYEVTLGEGSETGVEGSTSVPQPSKKSRLSSSSSSDSGSRGGFRFPRLELSVSPKK